MSPDGVTVCIATIPIRAASLAETLASAMTQTILPDAIVVEYDHDHTGAAATKNRALGKVTTRWVTFIDDDDTLMPEHIEVLLAGQHEHGADVTYSMPYCSNRPDGMDPIGRQGQPFDADELRRRSYIHGTSLIRAELFQSSGGFQLPNRPDVPGSESYDDWGGFLSLLDYGATFHHVPQFTFVWNITEPSASGRSGNTSGRGDRW